MSDYVETLVRKAEAYGFSDIELQHLREHYYAGPWSVSGYFGSDLDRQLYGALGDDYQLRRNYFSYKDLEEVLWQHELLRELAKKLTALDREATVDACGNEHVRQQLLSLT